MRIRCFLTVIGFGTGALTGLVYADVKPAPIFQSHMVLQRESAVPIWGTAAAGESVTVQLADQKQVTTAGADGKWRVEFDKPAWTGATTLTFQAKNRIELTDVLLGEVWICSGQSNMDFKLENAKGGRESVQAANHPMIRVLKVERAASDRPIEDFSGTWQISTPESVAQFSAVGFFFGRRLHDELHCPIGLIHTAFGGTPAEAWTPIAAMQTNPELQPIVQRYQKVRDDPEAARAVWKEKWDRWVADHCHSDPGRDSATRDWESPEFDDSAWKSITLPATFDSAGEKSDGAFWVRRSIDLPAELAGKDLNLSLGRIDDWDTTFFNGQAVGSTGAETPEFMRVKRKYRIPGAHVKAGKNVLAIRVFDCNLLGGFTDSVTEMRVWLPGASDRPISLAGEWRFRVETALPQKSSVPPRPGQPVLPNTQDAPANLYNAMINPLVPFAFRGVIWYQGESNAPRAFQYRALLSALVTSWRDAWKQGDFPFLVVQLPDFMQRADDPNTASTWAEIRESQAVAVRGLNRAAIAVTLGLGEERDIHPTNKADVGSRLALLALRDVYEKRVTASGPKLAATRVQDNSIVLEFDSKFSASGDAGRTFAIAGDDRVFQFAHPTFEGNRVTLTSPTVAKPVSARYAWSDNPAGLLFGESGLPAEPFRTDDWPLSTQDKR